MFRVRVVHTNKSCKKGIHMPTENHAPMCGDGASTASSEVTEISSAQQVRFVIPRSLYEEILNFSSVMGYRGSIMRTLVASFAIARRMHHLIRGGGKILCITERDGKKEMVELFFDFKPSSEV